jgi:hypothetical protein
MKKITALFFATIIILNVSGQSFGLKGGMALTSFSGSDIQVIDKNTGFYLGAFLKMGENNIQWSPEIIFHQKGASTSDDTLSLSLNYIDMGVNVHFHINDELALTAGPYVGYAATGNAESEDINDWNKYNRVEFGANLGATYAINDLLNIDLRYGIGLTNIKDDGVNMQNTSLQVGIGYIFSY